APAGAGVEPPPGSDGRAVAASSAGSAFAQIDHANVASGFSRTAITNIHRSVERSGAIGTVALGAEQGGATARELRSLERDARGYWSGWFADLRPGTLYRFRIDRDDGQIFPDPASRYQPPGVQGPSQVIDPAE